MKLGPGLPVYISFPLRLGIGFLIVFAIGLASCSSPNTQTATPHAFNPRNHHCPRAHTHFRH